jgi:hypothetical protein
MSPQNLQIYYSLLLPLIPTTFTVGLDATSMHRKLYGVGVPSVETTKIEMMLWIGACKHLNKSHYLMHSPDSIKSLELLRRT